MPVSQVLSNLLWGIFAITFLGSVFFAWIYAEWKFNLLTAIFLHCLMNLYWLIFDADNNALGGTYANIFRFATIFVALAGTVIYKRRMNIPLEISGKTWWMKSSVLWMNNRHATYTIWGTLLINARMPLNASSLNYFRHIPIDIANILFKVIHLPHIHFNFRNAFLFFRRRKSACE